MHQRHKHFLLPLPLLPETARYLQRAGQQTVAIGLDAKTGKVPDDIEQEARNVLDGFKAMYDGGPSDRNPLRRVFGPAVIDPDLEQRLTKRLTREQWAAAQQRADRWQPIEQPAILPPPTRSPVCVFFSERVLLPRA